MIDLLLKKWREVVSYKNIKTSIRGKKARDLLQRLVLQYKRDPGDILKIFKTLQENTTFELYWLTSDEMFEKYLREAELLIKQDAYSGYKGLLPGLTGFFEVYINPELPAIKSGNTTYAYLLSLLPEGVRETIWWFAIDPVLYYVVKYKVPPYAVKYKIPSDKRWGELLDCSNETDTKLQELVKKLSPEIRKVRKKRAFMRKLRKEYESILENYPMFREVLYEAFDAAREWVKSQQRETDATGITLEDILHEW